jgi:hypothetical protein
VIEPFVLLLADQTGCARAAGWSACCRPLSIGSDLVFYLGGPVIG